MLNIENRIIPISAARPGTKRTKTIGVTIHNTGNHSAGAGALAHASYMANGGKSNTTSYHFVVDESHIIQLIPDNEIAWHAGDGATGRGNTQTIAIEICDNSDGDILKATENAAELCAYLLKKYGVEAVYQHWHHSGKNCPEQLRKGNPYSWEHFIDRVTYFENGGSQNLSTKSTKSTKSTTGLEPCSGYVKVIYTGKDGVDYHSKPEWTEASVAGAAHFGDVFTVVGKQKVAGVYMYKLKSGNWITSAAQYVKFLTELLGKKKTVTEIAKEVMSGYWGNGADRKARLEKAGYNYQEVQAEVNRLCR